MCEELSVTFSDPFDAETLPTALDAAARRWGDREAHVFADRRLTYGEIAQDAERVASGLVELGVTSGQRVAVLMAGYGDWPAVYFGVTRAGAILVPLNTRLTPPELADLIRRSGATAVIYRPDSGRGRDLRGRVRAAMELLAPERRPRHVIVAGGEAGHGELTLSDLARGAGRSPIDAAVASESIAAIVYTSGSTGTPKGAMLNHRALLRGSYYASGTLEMGPGDRFFNPQPFFHAGGAVQVMLAPVVTGVTAFTQAYFNAAEALEIMERERCTLTLGHQPHWVDYLSQPGISTRRLALRAAYVIGDAGIRHDIYERLGLVTVSPYGMTETHLGGVSARLEHGVQACLNTYGHPFPGVEMTIRDVETDEPVRPGDTGEICLGGWCPMAGYLDEEELTAAAFDASGAIRTGDLGRVAEDGFLRLVGRRKEMIRVGGENVSPSEIADVLCAHPAVKQAVVVGIDDPRLGEVAAAAIEYHSGAAPDPATIQSFCGERLARYKIPRRIEVIDAWPMTGTGKIDRVAIRTELMRRRSVTSPARSAATSPATPSPRSDQEERIA